MRLMYTVGYVTTAAAIGLIAPAAPGWAAPARPGSPPGTGRGSTSSAAASHASSWVARDLALAARRRTTEATDAPATVPADLTSYLDGDRTDLQWALEATHVQAAWQVDRGAGVVVATIDTGVDATAPDLAGQILPGGYLTSSGAIAAGSPTDTLGHGTHVAGIIAGRGDGHGISGVAPEAKILPVDINTTDGVLTGSNVASAIAWAVAHGARVINLSLGFADVATGAGDVTAVCRAVSAAVDRGVVIVAAAGNDGEGTDDAEAPADCPGAISVAALDNDLNPTSWSSFDRTVTLAAPGDAIYSTVPAAVSPLRYAVESGTSMASPFVAGVAALLLADHPDWTPAQVTARLTGTALDLPPAGDDPRTGAGVVDPAAALGVDAPVPSAVPVVTLQADPYASRTGAGGDAVFDEVELHWVPDPTFAVTSYRITRWTDSGTSQTTVAAGTVRAFFPAGPAGYQVTAVGPAGEVPSAPLWFPLAGQDYSPLSPVTRLRATWTRAGGLSVRWANPAANSGRADQYAVLVDGQVAVTGEDGPLPTEASVPASVVPAGDLEVTVMIGSSSTLDIEETRTLVSARVPFSGTAVSAGGGRYRIDLLLAPSHRSRCGACTGTLVTIRSRTGEQTSRLDATGQVVVVVPARPSRGRITVSVLVPAHRGLDDSHVSVPLR